MGAEVVSLTAEDCCARCSSLADLARVYADAMGLRDWSIIVDHELPVSGNDAEIDLHVERKLGRLRVQDLDAEDTRHAIAHELGHALLRDLMETVRGGVADELSGSARRVFLASVQREEERLVDVLATVFEPVLPLA